jgi:methionyl-tRNA formyltransferase
VRVVLLASCAGAPLYLDALESAGERPVLIVTSSEASSLQVLPDRAAELGVPFLRQQELNQPEFLQELTRCAADLIVVAGWPKILRQAVRSAARVAVVNFHPSLLPDYRGRHPLFWAILRGERRVGITVHHLTEDVDAGPILLQREIDVADDATALSLGQVVDRAGAELVPALLELAQNGALPPGVLPDRAGSYFPPVRAEDGLVDWTRPAALLQRLLRAAEGTLPVMTFFSGMKLIIRDAAAFDTGAASAPGSVLAVGIDGVDVATGQGVLRIMCWAFMGREHRSPELAALVGIKPGSRFSHNPALDRSGP